MRIRTAEDWVKTLEVLSQARAENSDLRLARDAATRLAEVGLRIQHGLTETLMRRAYRAWIHIRLEPQSALPAMQLALIIMRNDPQRFFNWLRWTDQGKADFFIKEEIAQARKKLARFRSFDFKGWTPAALGELRAGLVEHERFLRAHSNMDPGKILRRNAEALILATCQELIVVLQKKLKSARARSEVAAAVEEFYQEAYGQPEYRFSQAMDIAMTVKNVIDPVLAGNDAHRVTIVGSLPNLKFDQPRSDIDFFISPALMRHSQRRTRAEQQYWKGFMDRLKKAEAEVAVLLGRRDPNQEALFQYIKEPHDDALNYFTVLNPVFILLSQTGIYIGAYDAFVSGRTEGTRISWDDMAP